MFFVRIMQSKSEGCCCSVRGFCVHLTKKQYPKGSGFKVEVGEGGGGLGQRLMENQFQSSCCLQLYIHFTVYFLVRP